ncbi:uncharacterized protein il2 [Paralichthys olivaceus]|uniref:Interleukin-2 n=1 Tax=Paralichthys olivaceus TaxID=8255 RepID=A0A2D1WBA0_PAROL|nr:interleukin 2 [Paralichthys olivaceus]BCL05865.1 interleukin-2 [Paralichthys olivaceus]
MEHFIGILFQIAAFFLCLQARCLPIEDASIGFIRTNVTCLKDSKFYAPTNVKVECIPAAMDCVMRELKGTVRPECDGLMTYVLQAIEFFELKTEEKDPAPTTSAECTCEKWPQTGFSDFLDQVESLLQLEKSAQPCKASP